MNRNNSVPCCFFQAVTIIGQRTQPGMKLNLQIEKCPVLTVAILRPVVVFEKNILKNIKDVAVSTAYLVLEVGYQEVRDYILE